MVKIGIDLDGVLSNNVGQIIIEAKRLFNIDITPKQITEFALENCTPLTTDQVIQMFNDSTVFKDMIPIEGAIEATRKLLHAKTDYFNYIYHVDVVTDRPLQFYELTNEWLLKNGFHWNGTYLVKAKDKPLFVKDKGIEIFIEDRYETAIKLAEVCKTVYLFDRTYNQGELPENVIRINNWNEILERLNV